MADVILPKRIASLLFTLTAIAALSFCQLSVFPIGDVGGTPVYVVLTIAPLMMGAVMFGPLLAALFGLFAGAVLFAHASLIPLDYFESYYFTNPVNTFVLFTVLGAAAGCAFYFILKRKLPLAANVILICLVCLVLSFAMSMALTALAVSEYGGLDNLENTSKYLLISRTGMTVQILVDALAASILSLAGDAATKRAIRDGNRQRLARVFSNWMIMVSAIVFMATSSVIFTLETMAAWDNAENSMLSEVSYLASQITVSEDEGTPTVDLNRLLSGYSVELDGHVVITDKAGTILATNDDDNWPVGESFAELSGYQDENVDSSDSENAPDGTCQILEWASSTDSISELQALDAAGQTTMETVFVMAAKYDTGYVAMVWDNARVYATRFGTMAAATILAALLIVAIGVLANILLRETVIRRIDDTNSSLEKITYGNLDERVKEHDTLEFHSLSQGINTTVVALKETIEEVEKKNAQDMATAKAIQEDSLPTEFPAFPQIETFDIYASMKTAKEVGGDFYDFFEIDDNTVGFLIADVSGKGIPGALFMMAAKNEIENRILSGMGLAEAVATANAHLCANNEAGMFVTMWAATLDWTTGELTYVNAGHNFPLLRHGQGGAWEWLKKKCGLFLGTFDIAKYRQETITLQPGDELILYTDGVNEAFSLGEEEYGNDRLDAFLAAHNDMRPEELVRALRNDVAAWAEGAEQSDDITILVVEYGV